MRSHDLNGNISGVDAPGGVLSTTRSFDAAGQVAQVTVTASGSPASWAYSRSGGGTLASVSSTGLGSDTGWSYDGNGQVSATAYPTGAFAYDAAGEPTRLDGNYQAFDASGELCAVSTAPVTSCPQSPTVSFDANGQRTQDANGVYTWNGAGELAQATASGATAGYQYSADGLRVAKTVSGTATDFVWDTSSGAAQLIGDGSDYYVYGPDGLPVERIGADPTLYLAADGQGSIRMSTTTTGAVNSKRTYGTWGQTLSTSGPGVPPSLGWQSQYQDPETGLYYLQHRYYDPTTAQFLSPDPLYTITGSRYGYAYNDPINGSDPTGLFWGEGTLKKAASATGKFIVKHRKGIAETAAAVGAVAIASTGVGAIAEGAAAAEFSAAAADTLVAGSAAAEGDVATAATMGEVSTLWESAGAMSQGFADAAGTLGEYSGYASYGLGAVGAGGTCAAEGFDANCIIQAGLSLAGGAALYGAYGAAAWGKFGYAMLGEGFGWIGLGDYGSGCAG